MNTFRHNIALAILACLIGHQATAQLAINEWMPDNVTALADESGEFDDWIELYNSNDDPIDIQGYYLSDDSSNPLKFQIAGSVEIPANGFVLLWADKDESQGANHLGFKLSSTGESILLSDANGILLDEVSFGNVSSDYSMGSFPDGNNDYYFFSNYTPESSNEQIGDPSGLPSPTIAIESGFYNDEIEVLISTPDPDINIYYTLDGSAPNENSFLYDDAITINHTTVLRAISEKNGFPNSKISSNIYYFDVSTTLSTLSLVGDPNDFFGTEGIYSNPYEGGSDWERYCQIQYFENNELSFSSDCGIRIQGSSSVGNDKKSFRLFFESEYGQKWLEHDLFEDNKVDRFRNLVLRSGYDDDLTNSTGTLLRDPFCSDEYERLDGLTSDSEWITLTINGDYWGIYEIRESVNEHFIESHTDWNDFDMIRFTKEGPELKEGTMDDWNSLTNFLGNNDLSDPANYESAMEFIDEENLINLLAFVNTTAYSSWTWGCSAYKEAAEGSKWKFTVWDMDRSLFQNGWNNYEEFENTDGIYWANFIPKALIQNVVFRNKFLVKTADLINSSFRSTTALETLENLKNEIAPEVEKELNRWVPDGTYAEWEEEVEDVEYFVDNRGETIMEQAIAEYNIPATNEIALTIEGEGALQVNSLSLTEFPWDGKYFEGIPTNIIAQPAPGYYFSHWSDNSLPQNGNISIDFQGTKQLTAHFVFGNTDDNEIVINEVNYNSADSLDAGDWIELYNNGHEIATLDGWYLMDEKENYFSLGSTSVAPGDYLVIAEDLDRFAGIYPFVTNVVGAFGNQGTWSFGFSNSGEKLSFINADSSFYDFVDYNDKDPWSIDADGKGSTLQLISPELDNELAGNWLVDYPTPGAENLTGNKMQQEITTASFPNKIATDEPFEVTATSSSLLEVNIEFVSGPGNFDNGILTLDGVSGELLFEASQQGNEEFFPAEILTFTISVSKAPQSIEYTEIGDQLPSVGLVNIDANASSGLELEYELLGGPAILNGTVLELTGEIGEVAVSMNQAGDATYFSANEKLILFDVYKLDQSISITQIADQFTLNDPFEIDAFSDSGLTLEYEIISGPASIAGNIITLDGLAGTVVLQANQAGDIDHFEASEMSNFDVLLSEQTIDFPMLDNHLNTDLPFEVIANASSNLPVTFEITSGPATIVNDSIFLLGEIGTVEVLATQLGNETFAAAISVTRSFQVTAEPLMDQVITWTVIDNKFTFDLPFKITATASSDLPIIYEIEAGPASVLADTITLTGEPGEVFVRATQLGNEDFNPASAIVSFEVIEVVPEDQVIDFIPIGDHFNTDPGFMISATSNSGLLVDFEILSGPAVLDGSTIQLNGSIGTVVVRAYQIGDNFYNPAEAIQSFEVKMVSGTTLPLDESSIVLFPNPANNQIQLVTDISFNSLLITNVLGEVVWMSDDTIPFSISTYFIDFGELTAGIYNMLAIGNDGVLFARSFTVK